MQPLCMELLGGLRKATAGPLHTLGLRLNNVAFDNLAKEDPANESSNLLAQFAPLLRAYCGVWQKMMADTSNARSVDAERIRKMLELTSVKEMLVPFHDQVCERRGKVARFLEYVAAPSSSELQRRDESLLSLKNGRLFSERKIDAFSRRMQSSISARPHRLASYVYVIHVLFFGLFEEAGYPEFISNSKRELEGQLCDLSRGLSSSERLDALKEALLAIQWIEGCLMDTAPEAGPDAAAGTAVTADEVDEELRICVESMELEEVQYMEYANGEGGDRTVGEACAKGEGAERWMHGLSSTGDGAKLVRLVWQRRVKSSIKIRV